MQRFFPARRALRAALAGVLALACTLGQAQTTRADARLAAFRFLNQASFGPVEPDIRFVVGQGKAAWLDAQFALLASSHRAWWEAADAEVKAANPTNPSATVGQDGVWQSFWFQAVNGPDQLRLRMALALSEIFVISAVDGNVGNQPRAMAAWLDMLGERAFGTYRELLESVTLHPLMGLYLTSLRNQKADASGRIPDQNYARESMQLFSVGLVKLNPDGTPFLQDGHTVETYGPDDVAGLSRVFTGFSWACPATNASCFNSGATGGTSSTSDPDRHFKPMQAYPQYHSTEAKSFLGVTIPAQATPDPQGSLRVALDTLANHPNTGPFVSRQLIQRLVTSNPSPTYVRDVAAVFANNGAGVRGDLRAVLRAILLHPEAERQGNTQGKVREPILRLAAYLRAYPHSSDTGRWRVGNTDSASGSLGQTALRAPSVFNFFRPGYSAPGSQGALLGLVAPELQLLNETSAAGWVNFMRDNLSQGVGQFNGTVGSTVFNRRDLQRDWSPEMALASDADMLTRTVLTALLGVANTRATYNEVAGAVGRIAIPAPTGSNQASIDAAKRNRVWSAILLTLASPEFINQK